MLHKSWLLSLICFLTYSSWAVQQEDSPLLSRYPGSEILAQQEVEFGSQEFLIKSENGIEKISKEGKVTRIKYMMDPNKETSALAILRNAQLSLEKAGFKIKTRMSGEELHNNWQLLELNRMRVGSAYADLRKDGAEYILMTRQSTDSTQYVAIATDDASPYHPTYYLILEEALQTFVPLEVSTLEVSNGLKENGKIELYGIYFDTGKSLLKPESTPMLEKIAQVLSADPALKVYIVGHTDSAGIFSNNMQLSQERAQAVTTALIKNFGIDGTRLKAHGVASLAPLATNANEQGRAKNRRVELVVQ